MQRVEMYLFSLLCQVKGMKQNLLLHNMSHMGVLM